VFVALLAFTLMITSARAASAFGLDGHEIIEASAYKRLMALELVPGTRVSGRTLLATLIADGVLYQPPCFDLTHPKGDCPLGGPLRVPLAYWPVLGSGTLDLILDRQLGQEGQCQHFMAETKDGLSPRDPRLGVPTDLVTIAYTRCARLAGLVFDRILRIPRLANWRLGGVYALIHGIEDSFSAAHVARDEHSKIIHLLSWTLIDWPTYFRRSLHAFPPDTHHAITDARDMEYLRADGRAADGSRCDELANPYAVPESCLTPRALLAVAAVEDLLVDLYRLRDQAKGEGRTASLSSPDDAAVWRNYVDTHLASAEVTVDATSARGDGRPRPDVFVGALANVKNGGWGLGAWGAWLLVGPALPFALTFSGGGGYSRVDGDGSLAASAGAGLLLPLVRRFSIGALPAGVQVQCTTSFKGCSVDAVANVGNLLVPLGDEFWLGFEGPRWSWIDRAFTGTWFGVAFGWTHERLPKPDASVKDAAVVWSPPRPDEVAAFRQSRGTFVAFAAATMASTADNEFVGGGLTWRLDRDRWNRRAGVAPGVELEVDEGVINGNAQAGALSVAPLFAAFLSPNRLAVTIVPALLQIGSITGQGFGADVGGRAGLVFEIGKVEVAVDSPPISYLSRSRWHTLPITVRLGLLFDGP
jgi:hypothetical protein